MEIFKGKLLKPKKLACIYYENETKYFENKNIVYMIKCNINFCGFYDIIS